MVVSFILSNDQCAMDSHITFPSARREARSSVGYISASDSRGTVPTASVAGMHLYGLQGESDYSDDISIIMNYQSVPEPVIRRDASPLDITPEKPISSACSTSSSSGYLTGRAEKRNASVVFRDDTSESPTPLLKKVKKAHIEDDLPVMVVSTI